MGIAYFKPSAMLSARLSSLLVLVVFDVEVLSVVIVSSVVEIESVVVVGTSVAVLVVPEDIEVIAAVVVVVGATVVVVVVPEDVEVLAAVVVVVGAAVVVVVVALSNRTVLVENCTVPLFSMITQRLYPASASCAVSQTRGWNPESRLKVAVPLDHEYGKFQWQNVPAEFVAANTSASV